MLEHVPDRDHGVTLALPERYREHLHDLPTDIEVNWYRGGEDAAAAAHDADVFWMEFLPRPVIEAIISGSARLRWFAANQVGAETWPLELMRERGIVATNGAGIGSVAIAETTVLAMLAATKGFPDYVRAQDRREWLRPLPRVREVEGMSALIVGFGSIGRAIGDRLRAFGMTVVGVRRQAGGEPGVIGPDDWRARLGEFDWVILTTPLTQATRDLIGTAELKSMRSTAWLANVARGELIDGDALLPALESGEIGGAYLDAPPGEPLPADSRLWSLPNVIITPHSSALSDRREVRAARLFLDNVNRFLEGRELANVVDFAAGY